LSALAQRDDGRGEVDVNGTAAADGERPGR